MAIPTYPFFKSLQDLDKSDIKYLNSLGHPFYSDSFYSILVAWYNEKNQCSVSLLNKDLAVIRIFPLGSNEHYAIISGHGEADIAALKNLKNLNKKLPLKDIPLHLKDSLDLVNIKHDFDLNWQALPQERYDYIYDVEEQFNCSGGKFASMRWHLHKFEKLYGNEVRLEISDNMDTEFFSSAIELFEDWFFFETDGARRNEQTEVDSFNRLIAQKDNISNLVVIQVFFGDKLTGFSVAEICNKIGAISHFQKANLNLSYINYFMFYALISHLYEKNINYLNSQEDCGIPGLMAYKKGLHPYNMGVKYQLVFN